jgi:hypothetical protein
MPYSIAPGPHPDFYILTYTEQLAYEELLIDDKLHLNEGRLIYVLADTSHMSSTLPDGFMEAISKSFVVHENIGHIASFNPSSILWIAAQMVIKFTGRYKKITVHKTYQEAYDILMMHIQEQQAAEDVQEAKPTSAAQEDH